MPPVKISRSSNGKLPTGDVTPEEAAAIRSGVAAKEQTPSTRIQSIFENWREIGDQLGDPFEVERIPLSKLRAMRRDPMLGFGLSFIKTPHIRARWYINARDSKGPNAQVAAHLDYDLRRIYASYVSQHLNSLEFGFQAIGKRFEERTPAGTYIETDEDSGEQTEKPIWSQGGVQPIGWKPFVPLRPEGVNPIWDKGTGEFAGIEYSPTGTAYDALIASLGAQATGGQNKETVFKIDLPHALWVTNDKDANFGSIFGYPRLGYAYRYWWSYWFRWAIADRAFERKADPSVIVYHPEGEFTSDAGTATSFGEYALAMGERIRSGGVIALPSTVYEDANGRGTVREWEIDFTKDSVNFQPFDDSFNYLDIQKLRSLAIPEQSLIEGGGGTSSRNVAKEMGSSFVESQAVISAQISEHINRYIIPQWLAVNYPEFMAANGTAQLIIRGFADEDIDFTNQVITLIGQQDTGATELGKLIDLHKVLEDRGLPIASFQEQQRRQQEIIQQQQLQAGPTGPVAPVPGQSVGAVPALGPAGSTGAGSATGFSYIQPREVLYLADQASSEFLQKLPDTPHYNDPTLKTYSKQLFNLYRDLYRDEYQTAIDALLQPEDTEAADIELAEDNFLARAQRLIRQWKGSEKWPGVLDRSKDIFSSVAKRAAKKALKAAKLSSKPSDEDINSWIAQHLQESAAKIAETTRIEVRDFLAKQLEAGITDREELAQLVKEHFDGFETWKAERAARTEIRDIYNGAVLIAAQSAERQVQALDAQYTHDTDKECLDRAGKIFDVDAAFKEAEHPNGTLAWRILPANLSIQYEKIEGELTANYDEESKTLTLAEGLDRESEARILMTVVDSL